MGNVHGIGGPATRALTIRAAWSAALLSLLFVVVYGGTNWFTAQRPATQVTTWYFDWELAVIPFVPLLIVPYMSIDLFFVAAPFLCRDRRAKLLDFQAWVAEPPSHGGPIEIRYAPELGLLSPLASQLVPKLSFWFDARAPYGWVAHRLPLYTGGPEVLVVREGTPTAMLAN